MKPVVFMSYAHRDNWEERLTRLREHLSRRVSIQRGEDLSIFQDSEDIRLGQNWRERIETSLDEAMFFIAIVTPSFFNSDYCRAELERFLARERRLGRNDLILPVYYVEAQPLEVEQERRTDRLAQAIHDHQYFDWRQLWDQPWSSRKVQKALSRLAIEVHYALKRVGEADVSKAKVRECLDLLHSIKEANGRVLDRIEAQGGTVWERLGDDDYNRVCKECADMTQQHIENEYFDTLCNDPDVSAVCERKWYLGERLAEYEEIANLHLRELHDVTEPQLSPGQLDEAITAAIHRMDDVVSEGL
jgi:hypothetical protein